MTTTDATCSSIASPDPRDTGAAPSRRGPIDVDGEQDTRRSIGSVDADQERDVRVEGSRVRLAAVGHQLHTTSAGARLVAEVAIASSFAAAIASVRHFADLAFVADDSKALTIGDAVNWYVAAAFALPPRFARSAASLLRNAASMAESEGAIAFAAAARAEASALGPRSPPPPSRGFVDRLCRRLVDRLEAA